MLKGIKVGLVKQQREAQELANFRKQHLQRTLKQNVNKNVKNDEPMKGSISDSMKPQVNNLVGSIANAKGVTSAATASTAFNLQQNRFKTIEDVKKERVHPDNLMKQTQESALDVSNRLAQTESQLIERVNLRKAVAAKEAVGTYGTSENEFYYDSLEIRSAREFMFFYEILKRLKAEKMHEEQRQLFLAKLKKITELQQRFINPKSNKESQITSVITSNQDVKLINQQSESLTDLSMPTTNNTSQKFNRSAIAFSRQSPSNQTELAIVSGGAGVASLSDVPEDLSRSEEKKDANSLFKKAVNIFKTKGQSQQQQQQTSQTDVTKFMTMKQANIQLVEISERIRKKTKTTENKELNEEQELFGGNANTFSKALRKTGFKAQLINTIIDTAIHRAARSQPSSMTQFDKAKQSPVKHVSEKLLPENKRQYSLGNKYTINRIEGSVVDEIDSEDEQEGFESQQSQQLQQQQQQNIFIDSAFENKSVKFNSENNIVLRSVKQYSSISQQTQQGIQSSTDNYLQDSGNIGGYPKQQQQNSETINLTVGSSESTRHVHNVNLDRYHPENMPLSSATNKSKRGGNQSLDYINEIAEGIIPSNDSEQQNQVIGETLSQQSVLFNKRTASQPNVLQKEVSSNKGRNVSIALLSPSMKEFDKIGIEKRIKMQIANIDKQKRVQNRVDLPEMLKQPERRQLTMEQLKIQQEKNPFKFSPTFVSNWVDLREKIEQKFEIPQKFFLHKTLNQRIKDVKSLRANAQENHTFVYHHKQNDYFH